MNPFGTWLFLLLLVDFCLQFNYCTSDSYMFMTESCLVSCLVLVTCSFNLCYVVCCIPLFKVLLEHLDLWLFVCHQIWNIYSHYFFKYFVSCSLSWSSYYMCVGLRVLPQISEAIAASVLYYLFIYFCNFNELFSCFLVLYSVVPDLWFSLSKDVFVSLRVLINIRI